MLRIDRPTGDVVELPKAAVASAVTSGNVDAVATVAATVDRKSRETKRKAVEAPGVEDGARRGQERTHVDNTSTLHVVGDQQDGQKRPPADTGCSTVATALRDLAEGYERTRDARRLRLALLEVLRSLDEDG